MKINSIKDYLKVEFEQSMFDLGFRYVKKDFAFKKTMNKFKCEIYFLTNTWVYEVDLIPYVGITHPLITSICNQCNYFVSNVSNLNLFVLEQICLRNGIIANGESIRYDLQLKQADRFELSDWNRIESIQPRLKSLLNLAISFIDEHACFQGLNKLYNNNPYEEYNQFCLSKHMHFFMGIILAKLCEEDYDYYKRIYERRVREEIDAIEIKDSFKRLLTLLDGINPSDFIIQ